VDEIADRIQYLYKNPDRVAEMGAAGKAHVEKEYQWPTIHAKYVEVWNR
jgi:glycosyltransferase involved in cell wall biosynthesis